MKRWYMLTIVGKDQTGIVSRVTQALFEAGYSLGEASMLRLGSSFTIVLMVSRDGGAGQSDTAETAVLDAAVRPVAEALGMDLHLGMIEGGLHQHLEADVQITVYGADRSGIVSQITGALAEAGLDILGLSSRVAGSEDEPIYVMEIEGRALKGIGRLRQALAEKPQGLDVVLSPSDTLQG